MGRWLLGSRAASTRGAIAMREPDQLRKRTEAAEERAASLARALTDDLMRPTPERGDGSDLLVRLCAARADLGRMVMQMRQVTGPPTLHERRPVRGAIAASQYLRDLRARLRLCDQALAAAAVCVGGHDWPLVPEPAPVLDLGAVQDRLNADLLTAMTYALTPAPQTADAVDLGCFPDIPLHAARFMRNIHLAHRMLLARKHAGPVRFIDIGCGGGLRVAQAAQIFAVADGLDYDAGYVAAASQAFAALRSTRCRAFLADGMTFDGYAGYDVLYFFEPMYQPELLVMEARMVGQSRAGVIVIAPGHHFEFRAAGLGLTRIHDAVYVKDTDTAAWLAETRRMGPHVASPDHCLPPVAGWVAPLWRACLANGIDPDAGDPLR